MDRAAALEAAVTVRAIRWSTLSLLLVACVCVRPVAAAVTALVATGQAGTPEYAERFADSAADIVAALSSLSAQENAVELLEAPDRAALLSSIEARAGQDQPLFVLVLIGHGTTDARGWRFNLPGDDLDDAALSGALANVQAVRELVVIATSASGALQDTLSQPGRSLVTATRSGSELNAVRFPVHFAQALRDGAADLDRNEIVTLAEAWRYTDNAVAGWYERENLLASEHPVLSGEGADTLALARVGALADAADDPVVTALLERRETLEAEFVALRSDKHGMAVADYYDALEGVLLRIARLQAEIDVATGWSDTDETS